MGLTEELQQRGVEFISLKDHIDTNSAIGKAMFRMLAGLQAVRKRITLVGGQGWMEQPLRKP